MRSLGEPFFHRRLYGRADYRGWALIVFTDMGEGVIKRWTMGHRFWICATAWFWLVLGLQRTWQGERVLGSHIAFIDRSGP